MTRRARVEEWKGVRFSDVLRIRLVTMKLQNYSRVAQITVQSEGSF